MQGLELACFLGPCIADHPKGQPAMDIRNTGVSGLRFRWWVVVFCVSAAAAAAAENSRHGGDPIDLRLGSKP